MRTTMRAIAWVVFRMNVSGHPVGVSAVCEQGEWEAMELAEPGRHELVRGGIRSEAEAEALARESSGFVAPGPRAPNYRPAKRPAAPRRGNSPQVVRSRAIPPPTAG